jgi:hypothetical protein
VTTTQIPDDLKELYEAAKGVEGTGLPIPWAADRAIELIERIARLLKMLKQQTDYSIQLQRLLESLKREDTPYPELHHYTMVIAVKEELAALRKQIKEAA